MSITNSVRCTWSCCWQRVVVVSYVLPIATFLAAVLTSANSSCIIFNLIFSGTSSSHTFGEATAGGLSAISAVVDAGNQTLGWPWRMSAACQLVPPWPCAGDCQVVVFLFSHYYIMHMKIACGPATHPTLKKNL